MFRFRFLVVFALIPLAAACGGSQTAAAAGGQTDAPVAAQSPSARITNPCKLLTQTEISAALGTKFAAGQLTNTGAGPRCRFFTASQEEVFIDAVDPSLFDAYAHSADAMLPGIGDKALWQHTSYQSYLYILKDGNLVTVGLPRRLTVPTPAVEKLAKLVAGRM
jgi:hypothetical protein